jgi:putative transposase
MTSNNNKENNLDKFCHSIGQNWYHIVLVTYKRRRIFQWKITNAIANEAIEFVCKKHNIFIFTKEVMDEHVHLFVNCPPEFSIRKLIQIVKGGTSYRIRKKFPSLKKFSRIWSRGGMYRSLGSVSAEIVQRYIDSSNVWEPKD